MTPLGYVFKRVIAKPEWLQAAGVTDVYSVSDCLSRAFADYINFWKHNGYWFFDTPDIMLTLAHEENLDLSGTTLFYYEAYELEFDDETRAWRPFKPEASFVTNVQVPPVKALQGFDVVSFSLNSSAECSPLACNGLAKTVQVNQHCLLPSFKEAMSFFEQRQFQNSEPGPYRIIAVFKA